MDGERGPDVGGPREILWKQLGEKRESEQGVWAGRHGIPETVLLEQFEGQKGQTTDLKRPRRDLIAIRSDLRPGAARSM